MTGQLPLIAQDPTLAIEKFIKMGVRPTIIPILVSYLTDRNMKLKINGEISREYALTGGGPQGSLLGLIEYLVQSNGNANCVDEQDRYKYIDDLTYPMTVKFTGCLWKDKSESGPRH